MSLWRHTGRHTYGRRRAEGKFVHGLPAGVPSAGVPELMEPSPLDESLLAVAGAHGLQLSALEEVARRSERELADFTRQLRLDEGAYKEIGVVLTGSFARKEVTDASDCDFLVLVDGLVPHNLITKAIQQVNDLAREKRYGDVGSQGVFGDFAIGTELMARIGLDADTNVNTTRRLLMLFESVSVFNEDVRGRLIRQLLERYCTDYDPESGRKERDHVTVPRFLLNDLIRYWRTMAVDFGAKQWRSVRTDWHLRYVKLLTTRKVLFAGSLMSLLRTPEKIQDTDTAGQFRQLLDYLTAECNRTPLARLMAAYPDVGAKGQDGLATVLGAYESLVAHLLVTGTRNWLAENPDGNPSERAVEVQAEVLALAEHIQVGLEAVFFDDALDDRTKRYGLF